ncbi:hypothetical protein AWH66_2015045 [Vibrio barjaei]|nr:hypothetical protein AWH66_2015045 [Vibrio barjaei]
MNIYNTIVVALVTLWSCLSSAVPDEQKATELEKKTTLEVNRGFFEAFNLPREKNWVYQLAESGQLQQRCYLNSQDSFEVGASLVFQNISMECIEINQTTRVFWPQRWVELCKHENSPYHDCILRHLN